MNNLLASSFAAISCLLVMACGGGGSDSSSVAAASVSSSVEAVEVARSDGSHVEASQVVHQSLQKDVPVDGASTTEPAPRKPYLKPGSTVDVQVGAVTPSSVRAELYEGSTMPDVVLQGTATGNLSLLSGKTLYVYVEDPAGLFQPSAQAYVTNSPVPALTLWLRGASQRKAGAFQGSLVINVCLDAACASRIAPVRVPYRVDVLRGYRTVGNSSTEDMPVFPVAMQVSSGFGEPLPAGRAVFVPPQRAPFASLYANVFSTSGWGDEEQYRPKAALTDNGDGTVGLQVTFPPLLTPGVRTADVYLFSNVRVGQNSGPAPTIVRVTATVLPNASFPVVFSPSFLALSAVANSPASSTFPLTAAPGIPGSVLTYEGVEFLLTPEQGEMPPIARNSLIRASELRGWPSAQNQYVWPSGCVNWEGTSFCLPLGVYTLRLRYRYVSNGVTSTVYLPGQLTVMP